MKYIEYYINNQRTEMYALMLFYKKYKQLNKDIIKYISEFCGFYNIHYDVKYSYIIEKINISIINRYKNENFDIMKITSGLGGVIYAN